MFVNTDTDTISVRQGYALDEISLARWMKDHVPGFTGLVRVEQFKGGQSNPTYKLTTRDRNYVLRRKPPGNLLKGAHAIEREFKVLSSLGKAGFPVARVHAICTDDSVAGTWFYIMDMIEGRIFWDATIPEVSDTDRPAYFDAMNTVLAHLHNLNPDAIGLADYGRPGDYFERQIRRWTDQYLGDEQAGRDPSMDRLVEWLPMNIPEDGHRSAIVHGDFRIDNVIFHPSEPRILAVLDWELSTLGHPFADFAYHAMMYRMPPTIVAGLAGANLAALNIPSEQAYLDAYCKRMGIDAMRGYDYYIAFNFFRLAAIFHGIKGRYLRGTAVSAQAKGRAAMFPDLAALALQQALRVDL